MVALGEALLIILLIIVVIVLVVIGVQLVRRNKAAQAERDKANKTGKDPFSSGDVDALRGDPRELGPGAIMDIRGETYSVRGSLRLTEDGWSWAEHFLDNAAGRRYWLSVEEDPELELVLFTTLQDATVRPGAKTVELEGRSYRHEESGTARYRAEGTTGLDPEGTVRYQDYTAGEDARLSFESYGTGDKWEVSRGEVLSRYEVRIYPPAD